MKTDFKSIMRRLSGIAVSRINTRNEGNLMDAFSSCSTPMFLGLDSKLPCLADARCILIIKDFQ